MHKTSLLQRKRKKGAEMAPEALKNKTVQVNRYKELASLLRLLNPPKKQSHLFEAPRKQRRLTKLMLVIMAKMYIR